MLRIREYPQRSSPCKVSLSALLVLGCMSFLYEVVADDSLPMAARITNVNELFFHPSHSGKYSVDWRPDRETVDSVVVWAIRDYKYRVTPSDSEFEAWIPKEFIELTPDRPIEPEAAYLKSLSREYWGWKITHDQVQEYFAKRALRWAKPAIDPRYLFLLAGGVFLTGIFILRQIKENRRVPPTTNLVFYAIALPFAAIGVIEALPGLFQWLFYAILLGTRTMEEVAHEVRPPAVFFRLHHMPAAFAAPLFLGAGFLVGWVGTRIKAAQDKAESEAIDQKNRIEAERAGVALEAKQREAEIARKSAEMQALLDSSATLGQSIPGHIRRANGAVLTAEREFEEGFLDPFWDAVEIAITELARVDSATRTIASNLASYRAEPLLSGSQQDYAKAIVAGISNLPASAASYSRLKTVVRKSKKSAEFTTIFHLRKTNKILVSGFSTLGQALSDFHISLVSAVDSVGFAIRDMQSAQITLGVAICEELDSILEISAESHASRSSTEAKIIDTLDNIQRGRRPAGSAWKPGTVKA